MELLRYSVLKQSAGSDIIYDFDKSISFEGDSGLYLQYSYTRAKSVLEKAKREKIIPSFKKIPSEITQLEKSISYFPEMILQSEKNYEPHFLVLYLTEIAGIFNNYYAKNKIVDKADEYSAIQSCANSSIYNCHEKWFVDAWNQDPRKNVIYITSYETYEIKK